jgi:GTPase SAR1 family protein
MGDDFKKILVVGEARTGKSTLLSAALCGNFMENYSRAWPRPSLRGARGRALSC